MSEWISKDKDKMISAIYDQLPPDFKLINPSITLDYREGLLLIQSNLSTIYGNRADWKDTLKKYYDSQSVKNRIISNLEQVENLSEIDIKKMLDEQTTTRDKITKLFAVCDDFNKKCVVLQNTSFSDYKKHLYECMQLLGIYPVINGKNTIQPGFFEYLISQDISTQQEYQSVLNKLEQQLNVARVVTSSLYKLFIPGLISKYPLVENVLQQQKQKWYFRGENAFYGSSKPGLFRGKSHRSGNEVLIDTLRYNECKIFLDKFDAVRFWNRSTVNYMALFQHYGLKTQMLDLTSDLMTALFFACCKYIDGRWYPLSKEDVAQADSRKEVFKIGGDSRYGILYRARTELMDMEYAVNGISAVNRIIPIGYQPFMRCSNQYGYMMLVDSEDYDMYKDKRFEKFKFRLTAEFCQWVYDEMDQGNKAYPNNDIPKIEKYLSKINSTDTFSEAAVHYRLQNTAFNDIKLARPRLKKLGYSIYKNQDFIITQRKIDKINQRYGIREALKNVPVQPVLNPMFAIY